MAAPSNKTNENALPQNNFSILFRPLYFVARIFGLLPFSIIYIETGDIQSSRVNKFDVLWFVLSFSAYSILLWFYQHKLLLSHVLLDKLGILTVCHDMATILKIILQIISIILDMYNRTQIIDILKQFANFDNEVTFIGFK